MMMPRMFGESLFDDFMDFPFEKDFLVIIIRCMANTPKIL